MTTYFACLAFIFSLVSAAQITVLSINMQAQTAYQNEMLQFIYSGQCPSP